MIIMAKGWTAMKGTLAGLGVAMALAWALPAAGQEVSVAAGYASYDLVGVGGTWVVAGGYRRALAGAVSWEAGASVLRYDGAGTPRTHVMPEAGLALALPAGPVEVILSAGAGASLVVAGPGKDEPTLYAGLGVDLPAEGLLRLRPGARVRWLDPWAGTVVELTMGVALGR